MEAAINEVVAKRMNKKTTKTMDACWRSVISYKQDFAVLNDELHQHFSRWFAGFNIKNYQDTSVEMKIAA